MRILGPMLLLFTATLHAQFTQQGAKLFAVDGANGPEIGTSVAISHDGNTIVAGGPKSHQLAGGAWIFTRNGKVWSQHATRLIGNGTGNASRQGSAVAISADGKTVLLGGPFELPHNATYAGAAWVFTRTGATWTQQGSALAGTGANGEAEQGSSVALSADGNTAIVGGPNDNGTTGAAWIFTRTNGVWSQQGSKLVGFTLNGPSAQGRAVALSGDGNTAIVGGPNDNLNAGAAWIFTRANGVWTPQSLKLIAFASIGSSPHFGASVALSHDGNTAIIGSPQDSSAALEAGAAWIFVRNGNDWTQQGGRLTGTIENHGGRQGTSVALSSDGNTAVIGGPNDHPDGGAWIFTRNEAGVWSEQQTRLLGTGGSQFGSPHQGQAVAISGDASTIAIGGPTALIVNGSVWPFAKAVPTIATFGGDGQSVQVETAFQPLRAILRNAADQPVANASVTFAIDAAPGAAGGSFASSATVLTDASGIATAPTLTANNVAGSFSVIATTASAPAAATFDLSNGPMAAPLNVVATATPTPTVAVTWSAVSGATMYEVVRSTSHVEFTTRTFTSDTSFVDSSQVFFFSVYAYKVRVVEPAVSGWSLPDYTTTVTFTDPVLDGQHVKGAHFMELRDGVNRIRAFSGLDQPAYTDPHLPGETIKAIHLTELRGAFDEALGRLRLPSLVYARPAIAAGSTIIFKSDVLELRAGVQ